MKKVLLRFSMCALAFGMFLSGTADAQRNNSTDLSGTYKLDAARSEDVSEIVAAASRNDQLSSSQRDELEDKLAAPETISIDVRGQQVTLASSAAGAVTFNADGRVQNVSNTRIRATLRGNTLKITNVGGDTDYTITLASTDGGRGLQITRMVTTGYLSQTVFADSFYNRTGSYSNAGNDDTYSDDDNYSGSDPKDDDNYSGSDPKDDGNYSSSDPKDDGYSTGDPNSNPSNNRNYPRTTSRNGDFYVPYGTVLTGTLENRITTKASQNNDRFRLTVEYPNEYRGAVIEGYISGIERSGKVTGSAKLTFNFETIRLSNGQTYDFAGVLQSITDTQGKTVKVNDEGEVKGKSQTKESIKRGGIGAGLGAIIGGVIGGGKGAIIGATIGGSAGAGSVAVEGKEDLELEQGTQMMIQSTSPKR